MVEDTDVTHYWLCEECREDVGVHPDYYQDNGTPVCCDRDMVYTHTEIDKGLADRLDKINEFDNSTLTKLEEMEGAAIESWCEQNLFGDRTVEGIDIPLSPTQEAIKKICVETITLWEARK